MEVFKTIWYQHDSYSPNSKPENIRDYYFYLNKTVHILLQNARYKNSYIQLIVYQLLVSECHITSKFNYLIKNHNYMISKSLLNTTSSAQQYYFQIRLHTITSSMPMTRPVKLAVYKGIQILDCTRGTLSFQGLICNLNDAPLNFYVPSYNPSRNIEFRISIFEVGEQREEIEIGQFMITSNPYIVSFLQDGTFHFDLSDKFNQNLEVTYTLYVQKSRVNLNASIKRLQSNKKVVSESETGNIKPFERHQEKIQVQTPSEKKSTSISFNSNIKQTKIPQIEIPVRQLSEKNRRIIRKPVKQVQSAEKSDSLKNNETSAPDLRKVNRLQRSSSKKQKQLEPKEKKNQSKQLEGAVVIKYQAPTKKLQLNVTKLKEESSVTKLASPVKEQIKPKQLESPKITNLQSPKQSKVIEKQQQLKSQVKTKKQVTKDQPEGFSLKIKIAAAVIIFLICAFLALNSGKTDKNKKTKNKKNKGK